jgi:hypothetical protein
MQWSVVYECIGGCSLFNTYQIVNDFIIGAALFVVQLALEIMVSPTI